MVGEGPMVAVDAPQGLEWLEVDRRNWYLRIEAAMDYEYGLMRLLCLGDLDLE